MMRRTSVSVIAGLLATSQALAQSAPSCLAPYSRVLFTMATGPGDLDATPAAAWYGLRCYSSAYIGPIADIFSPQDRKHTLLYCGLGGVVSETVYPLSETCAVRCTIKLMYNQGADTTIAPAMEPQESVRPTFAVNSVATDKGCAAFDRASSQYLFSNYQPAAQPFSITWVAKRTGLATQANAVVAWGSQPVATGFSNVSGRIYMGSPFEGVLNGFTEGQLHGVAVVIGTPATGSGTLFADGATNAWASGNNWGNGGSGFLMGKDPFNNFLTGHVCEAGVWNVILTPTEQTNIYNNQRTAWGIP